MDFPCAYRHLGIDHQFWEIASIVIYTPETLPPRVARVNTQPFGSSRAPASWDRVILLLQRGFLALLLFPALAFGDDIFSCERADSAASAFRLTKQPFAVAEFRVDESKDKKPAPEIHLLGTGVTFAPH